MELVETCNNGSKTEAIRAFEALYRRHKTYVLKIALRFISDRDQALDVLQETFSYLLRKFPPQGGGLKLTARLTTFLYPVIKHNALDALKKNRRFVSDENLPEPVAESSSVGDEIAAVFESLSQEHREVLMLRFVDGFKLEEIAHALEIPLGTVKSRIHSSLAQLRADPKTKEFFDS